MIISLYLWSLPVEEIKILWGKQKICSETLAPNTSKNGILVEWFVNTNLSGKLGIQIELKTSAWAQTVLSFPSWAWPQNYMVWWPVTAPVSVLSLKSFNWSENRILSLKTTLFSPPPSVSIFTQGPNLSTQTFLYILLMTAPSTTTALKFSAY